MDAREHGYRAGSHRRHSGWLLISAVALVLSAAPSAHLAAQGVPSAQAAPSAQAKQDVLREKVNRGTVGIITGGVNGTYIRIASDMSAVLDQTDGLRILPIVGKGSVQNITDLLYLRGVDIAIVQSDVLTFIKNEKIHGNIQERITYIAKLYNEELHLLAGKGIEKIQDLSGKSVNFGNAGSGTYMTAKTVFDALKIPVQPQTLDYALALEKVKTGELAAMIYVAGKPTELFSKIERPEGLHFLGIPYEQDVAATYLPSTLTHEDYPALIGNEQPVETVAVGALLAVYNWPRGSDRYRKVEAFIANFFGNFREFLKPPRHPKWQEVNLAAVVPGWNRFPAAEALLKSRAKSVAAETVEQRELRQRFQAFLQFLEDNKMISSSASLSEQERGQLFGKFLQWQEQQGR